MTAADLTWLDYAWPTFWLADTDALSSPAPAPEAEPTPIYEAAMAAHLAAGGRPIGATFTDVPDVTLTRRDYTRRSLVRLACATCGLREDWRGDIDQAGEAYRARFGTHECGGAA